jgi:ethanolamine ammonia-lyase small subunit
MGDEPVPIPRADDPWDRLRAFTTARIGLPRSGASLATRALLDFKLAHARARDAVSAPFDDAKLQADLAGLGLPVLAAASAAENHRQYLMRPDLGRRLAAKTTAVLAIHAADYDVAFVVTDGLSAGAVQSHAPPVLANVLQTVRLENWRIAPITIVRRGRVAVGDAVAAALHADIAVVLIGERPGLTATDSMGAYLTWRPTPQTTDAGRNCISNIRPDGIGYADAAFKLVHLLQAMRARRLSGVLLKEDADRRMLGQG